MAANEYLRERHPEALRDPKLRKHFHNAMFHGFDFDHTMLRIGSMNMLLHGIENPDIVYRGTDHVWFYDVDADGWSLDDKRTPLLSEDKLGPNPLIALSAAEHEKNNLPDIVVRWRAREKSERKRARTEQSFCVAKADLVSQGYDLSLNRYREVTHAAVDHRSSAVILAELTELETEIDRDLKGLRAMLT